MRLEREAEDEFRPKILEALQRRVQELANAELAKTVVCARCKKPMERKDARRVSWLSRFGRVRTNPVRYRCRPCSLYRRPLLELLGVEAGRICGSLARLLALLGTVAPFELAVQLAWILLGVDVSTMSVWRCVQRLGEACARTACLVATPKSGKHPREPKALTGSRSRA